MVDRLEKCKYCNNYQHIDRNAKKPFKCQLFDVECRNIYEMPRYDEVSDKEYRDKELEDYKQYVNESSKRSTRSYYILSTGFSIFTFIIASQIIIAIYLSIASFVYWFGNDYLTAIQVTKHQIAIHPILYGYLAITTIIELILSKIFRRL
jgi:hypothetical protein